MTKAVRGSGMSGEASSPPPNSSRASASSKASTSSDSASPSPRSADKATSPLPEELSNALGRLEGAITSVLDLDVDDLSQPQLEATLRRLQPQLDRVHGYRSRLVGLLAEYARSRQGNHANGHAAERARRDAARFLRSELHLTDSEAKRAVTAGQQARTSPSVSQATRDGRLNPEQSATIARLLEEVDAAVRDDLEAELLDAAGRMDAVALGRFGRRRLLELDPAHGERRERRDHRRRAFRLSQTSDGAVIPSGRLYGAQAESAMAAWHAFRRPDAPGEVRTPDQRGADAFEQLCAVALRAGEASSQHGERPQLLVVAEQQTLLDGSGVVELGFTGPVSLAAVRCLLSDCSVSRIGLGDQEVGVSVSKKVRTVPAGLWRVLVARDRGCTWSGCDAPAAWCDVAHGESPYAADGHLSPSNAALLCRRHHRAYDHGPYVMRLEGGMVRYERDPDAEVAPRTPVAEAAPRGSDAQLALPDPGAQLALPDPGAQLALPDPDAQLALPDPDAQLALPDPQAGVTKRSAARPDRPLALTVTGPGRPVTPTAPTAPTAPKAPTTPSTLSTPEGTWADAAAGASTPTWRSDRPQVGSNRPRRFGRGPPWARLDRVRVAPSEPRTPRPAGVPIRSGPA